VADIDYSYEKANKALYSTVLVEYKDLIWKLTNTRISRFFMWRGRSIRF
jgi:hypothetical protein